MADDAAETDAARAAAMRAGAAARAAQRPRGPELASVQDLQAGAVPARLYRPSATEERPLLVFFHGGFWILGDLESHDRLCRQLAAGADVDVLAVDYRRAPEHPWPAGVDDAVAAVRFAAAPDGLARTTIAIGGDSAGACLAALACLRLRDEGGPPLAAQVLLCPNTDLTGAQPSMATAGEDGGLDPAAVRWAAALWAPDPAVRADGRASPLHAADLHGLPPAVVITAEPDPLRDEGDAYARRLADAGVPTTHRSEPGLPHDFMQAMDLVSPAAAAGLERVIADVARVLGTA